MLLVLLGLVSAFGGSGNWLVIRFFWLKALTLVGLLMTADNGNARQGVGAHEM
jgi:hypothetical protein